MAQLNFDTRTAPPPREDFVALPAGEYPVVITDSDMKKTKQGNGEYLELKFQVIDGPAKNRNVWARLNLVNASVKAVEIANKDLNAICAAIGHVGPLQESALLHNKPLLIRLVVDGENNEIKAYKALEGAAPTAAPATPAGAPATSAPWGSKAA